jgi:hypothetical protein
LLILLCESVDPRTTVPVIALLAAAAALVLYDALTRRRILHVVQLNPF